MAASKKKTRLGDEEGHDLRSRIDEEGFDYAIVDYSSWREIRDVRFHALRKRYIATRHALDAYVEAHSNPRRSAGAWTDAELASLDYVAAKVEQKGIHEAFVDYASYREVRDKRFHTLRRAFLAAEKALQRYVSASPTRRRQTFHVQAERLETIRAEHKPKTLWQRIFGGG